MTQSARYCRTLCATADPLSVMLAFPYIPLMSFTYTHTHIWLWGAPEDGADDRTRWEGGRAATAYLTGTHTHTGQEVTCRGRRVQS